MEQDPCDSDLEKQRCESSNPSKLNNDHCDVAPDQADSIFPSKENRLQTEEPNLPEGALGRVLSKVISRVSTLDVGPPPDGGLKAWTQALMSHLVVFNTWGYINSFGVFQTYYVTALNQPPSAISWVGSVQIFLLFFIGTFSGRATDYGLFRPTFILGSMFQLLGVFMTSLSTQYWQLFLAQGICTGIGNGLVFCPILSLVSTYFSRKRSLAIGIGASGTATGGVVFPVIVQQLLPRIGFPWTVRVIGFVMFAIQCVTIVFTRTRLPPRKTGPLVEWQAFKELPYALFCTAMFLVFWGLYFAFYYIGSFGRNVLDVSQTDSINLLLIMNGVGLIGRLIPAYLADKYFGPLNLIGPFAFCAGIILYCWAAVSSSKGLVAFAVVYGLFGAGIQSLFPATLSSLTTDLKKAGVRMGMCFSVISLACLTGSPIAGALIQKDGGSFVSAQIYAGTIMMGIYYFLSHPFLYPLFRARLLPGALLSLFVLSNLFIWTYLPQFLFLSIFHGPGAWLNTTFLVLGEGCVIVALLFEAFFIDESQVDVFDAVLINEGCRDLVAPFRVLDPEAPNPVKELGRPTIRTEYSPFSFRQIVELIFFLPLNLIPAIGTPMFLIMTGYRAGPFQHWRYFKLLGFDKKERKAFIKKRQLRYTWFGTVALILQLVPVLSMFFLLTTAAGSALWVAKLEKEKRYDPENGAQGGDPPPAYSDEPDFV